MITVNDILNALSKLEPSDRQLPLDVSVPLSGVETVNARGIKLDPISHVELNYTAGGLLLRFVPTDTRPVIKQTHS